MGRPRHQPAFRDAREDEPWFQRLPPGHQARYRREFEAELLDWELAVGRERRAFRTCVLQGAGIFAAAHVLGGVGGLQMLLTAGLSGAAVGLAWWKLRADQLLAPILAMPVFFGLEILAVSSRMGPSLGSGFVFARFALVAFGLGGLASWLARERQAA